MYHGIETPAPHGEEHYTLTGETFEEQLQWLKKEHSTPSFKSFVKGEAPAGSVLVTFDDGEKSVATKAFPVMKELGMTGALFVTTHWISKPGYVNESDIMQLAAAGWTIGAHGASHRYLSDLSTAELFEELIQSRDALAQILGNHPVHMALPGGRENPYIIEAARRSGYRSICTSCFGTNGSPPNLFGINRITMRRAYNLDALKRIIKKDPIFITKIQMRQRLLQLAKRSLGNSRYELMRNSCFDLLQKIKEPRSFHQ
jgi:peptidoglycan/xylan/chitin deacetylase (PgdA/CDA1 family)